MNKLFFASMLALFLLVPAAQAHANAFSIGDDTAVTRADGDWTRGARPVQAAIERQAGNPGPASTGLRIADALDAPVVRVGLPALMIPDHRGASDAGAMLRPSAAPCAPAPADGAWHADRRSATPRLAIGTVKATFAGGLRVHGKGGRMLNTVADNGPSTLRIGPARAKVMADDLAVLNNLAGALRAAGAGYRLPRLGELASELDAKGM